MKTHMSPTRRGGGRTKRSRIGRRFVVSTALLATVGIGTVGIAAASAGADTGNGTVSSSSTIIGSGPTYTVNVSATGIKSTSGGSSGQIYHGDVQIQGEDTNFTTYTPLTSTDANGDITFPSFVFNPQGASSVPFDIVSPVQGGVHLQFTVSFNIVTPPPILVTPKEPTVSTTNCDHPNKVVTPQKQAGVVWTPAGPTTLKFGKSITYKATATKGHAFPKGAQKTFTFVNHFNPSVGCKPVTPPASSGGHPVVEPPAPPTLAHTGSRVVQTVLIGFLTFALGALMLFLGRRPRANRS